MTAGDRQAAPPPEAPGAGDDERRRVEHEVRRRYDRHATLGALGPTGPAVVAVADAVSELSYEQCDALRAAYRRMEDDARAAGDWPSVERAYEYARPWPDHPPDLMALDGWARNAFAYAGLVARERAAGVGLSDFVPVERAAEGAIMALEADTARRAGAHCPIGEGAARFLRQPWEEVMGEREAASPEAGPPEVVPPDGGAPGATPSPAPPGAGR